MTPEDVKYWLTNKPAMSVSVADLCVAIQLIPHAEFDEGKAQELIEAVKTRIEASNFKHTDHAINAVESLEDSATILWNAADDIRTEQYALHLEEEKSRRFA